MPSIVNLRQDPFERTPSLPHSVPGYANGFFAREFWRFVEAQQKVALAETVVNFPPCRLALPEAVKRQIDRS
jgi:hypothetical protein